VRVAVETVDVSGLFDFGFEAVESEVQATEAAGFGGFLDAVNVRGFRKSQQEIEPGIPREIKIPSA
jgi:hypothetical protein